MGGLYRNLIRPVTFLQDSEKAHDRIINLLKFFSQSKRRTAILRQLYSTKDLSSTVFGLTFPNPLGLAAGFDKFGSAVPAWPSLGFGFTELGGVTFHAQNGNKKPRMFRVNSERALINRMGFNNPGAEGMSNTLDEWKARGLWPKNPVGINLAKSMVTPLEDAATDYSKSIDLLWNAGDFFVINVSSPNTPGLRDIQESNSALNQIIDDCSEINKRKGEENSLNPKPILIKISPDLSSEALDNILSSSTAKIDGIVATNTTTTRPTSTPQTEQIFSEVGGLSGAPLNDKSTELIRRIFNKTDGKLPIIGVGGIMNSDDAWNKITAGASLLQIYTGLVFEGPSITNDIVSGLRNKIKEKGFTNISEAIGSEA